MMCDRIVPHDMTGQRIKPPDACILTVLSI